MSDERLRELFPGFVRSERLTFNGAPCLRVTTRNRGQEEWHYLQEMIEYESTPEAANSIER